MAPNRASGDPAVMEVTVSDGTTLHVREIEGAGATVVLVHALASSSDDLLPLAKEYGARGHRVVWFDQRGHGASGAVGEVTVERLCQDVVDVIEDRAARGAIAVGHSSGGYALLALGPRASSVVSRIVTIGTMAQITTPAARLTMRYAKSAGVLRVQRARAVGKTIVRLGSFGPGPDPAAVEQVWRSVVRCGLPTRAAFVDAMRRSPDLLEQVRSLTVPLVALRGRSDRVLSTRQLATTVAAARDGIAIDVPGAGHMLPVEDPVAVVDATFP